MGGHGRSAIPNPSSVGARWGAGLASAVVAGAVTGAAEAILTAGPDGLGPAAITFVALFAAYSFVTLCSVGIANVLWLIAQPFLGRLELVVLPLLTSFIAWQILTGTRWGLLSTRAILVCTGLLLVSYFFALARLRSAPAAG